MNNTNISAVATAQTTNKRNWLTKGSKFAKKAIMSLTVFCCMAMMCGTTAFAEGEATGVVDTSTFITTACTVLKSVICLIGGGVSLWGVVNLLEGYGNDNPGAKEP